MSKRKKAPITKAVLLDTGEDAVPARLGVPLGFHLPFECLQAYYDGGIHRPDGHVGDVPPDRAGHLIYNIINIFKKNNLTKTPFEQGVYVSGHHYPCEDVLGAHIRGGPQNEQEFVIISVESVNCGRPYASTVRNFTEMTDYRPPVQAENTIARAHGWSRTVAANIPRIRHSWGDAPFSDTCFYVGSGPSLRKNYEALRGVDREKAKVCAANEAFSFLAKRGVEVDYFFCIDATSPERWWTGFDVGNTCLVAAPFVNPDILNAPWKKVYWFNVAADGYYYNTVRKAHPHLLECDTTRGVGSSIIESSWLKGARRVVLAGCDFCYDPDPETRQVWRSVGSVLDEDAWRTLYTGHAHLIVEDAHGRQVPTYIGLAFEAGAVYGAAQCIWEKGGHVINATEGGVLRPNPSARYLMHHIEKVGRPITEDMRLKDAVDLVNAG